MIKVLWNNFVKKASETGIALIYIKDPETKSASVTLTMMIVSFTVVIVGVVGRLSQNWNIDMTQAFNLLYLTSGLYLGRKVTRKGDKISVSVETQDKANKRKLSAKTKDE